MNHIYRIVWSPACSAWLAVAESAPGRGKGSGRKLVAAALSLAAGLAQAAPLGGQVSNGAGSITQAGATTTITQSSPKLSLNWQSFNVGSTETVNFVQPSAGAIAVNRIYDTQGSQILGRLNANGQVYLVNPNGILFGAGAQVNVGALVASTLDLGDASLGGSTRAFSGSAAGGIVNQGTINAASGGYVALLGKTVSNQGTITAPLGTVALGAGSAVTLNFNGNSLVTMQVEQSLLNSLADNGGLIQADGGQVLMSAGARDALLASVVNNTGVIEARTVENHEGTITLLGGMAAGTVNVGGTLDASAPNGGNAGFIETSAAHVAIADAVHISTLAAAGQSGNWLIDPLDFTVAASGGDITGAALGSLLGSNNVTIQTSTGTNTASSLFASSGSNGDIFVNDAVGWSANTALTLNAFRNININQSVTASGASGSLALLYGQGAVALNNTAGYNVNASVNLHAGSNFSTRLGSDGTVRNFTVVTSLGAAGSTTGSDLQGINGGLAANYALGGNIDASGTSSWNSNAGFTPLGSSGSPFTGTFDGLGHTISNLSQSNALDNSGLFGFIGSAGSVKNLGLLSIAVAHSSSADWQSVGSVAGTNAGTLSSVYSMGTVTANRYAEIGGLVGTNTGKIANTYSTATVSAPGGSDIGGLAGQNLGGTINYSYASGIVSRGWLQGGLIGYMSGGNAANSFWDSVTTVVGGSAAGTGKTTTQLLTQSTYSGWDFVNTWYMVDGSTRPFLRSEYSNNISNAHQLQMMGMNLAASYTLASNLDLASALATPSGMWGGSAAGFAPIGRFGGSFTGSFDGQGHTISNLAINRPTTDYVGLFGYSAASNIRNVGLTGGSVIGRGWVGALVGDDSGNISNSYSTASVTGSASYIGGLVGAQHYSNGNTSISNSYSAGNVSGSSNVGGLLGFNDLGTVRNSYATGSVSGASALGGLVGGNYVAPGNFGGLSNSFASGSVAGTGTHIGALVGENLSTGSVINNFWDSSVNPSLAGIANGTASGASGLSAVQMKQMDSFASWNTATANTIANTGGSGAVWRIYEGHTTPLLTNFMTGLVLADAADAAVTYNGSAQSGGTSVHAGLLGAAATGTNVGFYNGYYSTQQSYDISGGNLRINAVPLMAISLSGSRAYDGTANVAASIFSLSGLVNGEDLTLSGFGTIASKNVGTYSVSLGSLALGNGSHGLAGNYTFAGGTQTATITKADLIVSGLSAVNKVYDATTRASLSGSATVSKFGSDDVTLVGTAVGTFADKDAAGNKTVTVAGISLGGNDAGNYKLLQPTGLTASIGQAQLTYVASAANFVNGQTPAGLSGTVSGLAGGDTLANATSGQLHWSTHADAASAPGSYAIEGSGLLASNYAFSQAEGNAVALTLVRANAPVAAPVTPPIPGAVLTGLTRIAVAPPAVALSSTLSVTQNSAPELPASASAGPARSEPVAPGTVALVAGAGNGPVLFVVNGGMRLPADRWNTNE